MQIDSISPIVKKKQKPEVSATTSVSPLVFSAYNKNFYKKVRRGRLKWGRSLLVYATSFVFVVFSIWGAMNYRALNDRKNYDASENIESYMSEKIADAEVKSAVANSNSASDEASSNKSTGVAWKLPKGDYYLEIPKLNVVGNVSEPATMEQATPMLDNSIVHLPGTSSPGQPGNTVLSGHSSSYVSTYYSRIFATLDKLQSGDLIMVYKNSSNFVYQVYNKEVIEPKLEAITVTSGQENLVLVTCWPIGTANQRYIVYAKRIK